MASLSPAGLLMEAMVPATSVDHSLCPSAPRPLGPMFAISESSLALSPGARFPTGPHPLLALCQVLGIGDR